MTNSSRIPYRPELVSAAQAAGFLHLKGSDLVFDHGGRRQDPGGYQDNNNSPIYYDFVLSCGRRPVAGRRPEAVSHLARLDHRTNIVEIQQYRIQDEQLIDLDRLLSPSDLTVAALSFHVWQNALRGKKVLLLLPNENYFKHDTLTDSGTFIDQNDDAMEYVVKMAEKHNIVYHIHVVQSMNGNSRRNSDNGFDKRNNHHASLPKRLAIMLRLMMCQGQPISVDITKKLIRQFSFFVEPRKWFLLWCY